MGNRRARYIMVLVEGSQLTFGVIAMGLDFIRIEDRQAYRLPDEFVFTLTGTLGLSVGRIDWFDGDRMQIRVERHGPMIG